jgi:hypothetical protein
MAGFCVQCGSPVAPGVKFCSKCGAAIAGAAPVGTPASSAPVPAPPGAPPVSAAPAAPAPSKGGSTALKIILVIVAIIVFFMLLVAGSCVYLAYRVKKKAHEFSQQLNESAPAYTGSRQPCAMLSASEAGRLLHAPVESAEEMGNTCEYHYASPNGNRTLSIEYTWQGAGMAMGLARGAMKMVAGMQTFQSVQGIGDEAYIAPGGSALMMRKGDVMVNIDLRANGISADTAERIASTIADRL